MQMPSGPTGSVEPTVFAVSLGTMDCSRVLLSIVLVAVVYASNEQPPLPLPYASSGFEVESNSLPLEHTDTLQAPSSYYAQPSHPEGFQVQSGYEGYIVPGAYGLSQVKPGILETIKPHLLTLASFLPKIAAVLVSVLGLVLIGTVLTTCVCAYTNLCHLSFLGVKLTGDSFRGFMTNDNISEIASFVQKSIKKYQEMSASSKRSLTDNSDAKVSQ